MCPERLTPLNSPFSTKKDAAGEPVIQQVTLPDGTSLRRFVTCPEGIEIFNTLEGPTGEPRIAPFPKATKDMVLKRRALTEGQAGAKQAGAEQGLAAGGLPPRRAAQAEQAAAGAGAFADSSDEEAAAAADSSDEEAAAAADSSDEEAAAAADSSDEEVAAAPGGSGAAPKARVEEADPADPATLRLNPDDVMIAVNGLTETHPSSFRLGKDESVRIWKQWCAAQPSRASDVPVFPWLWPAGFSATASGPATAIELSQQYNESIAYVNAVGGTIFTVFAARDADGQDAAQALKKLSRGEKLFVVAPPSDSLPDSVASDPAWTIPLWMCEVAEDDPQEGDVSSGVSIYWLHASRSKLGHMAGNW